MTVIGVPSLLAYQRIVVPLDGSSFAEVALEAARQVSALFDARIDLVGFGREASDKAALQQRLLDVAVDYPAARVCTGIDLHAGEGIADFVFGDDAALVCMSAHARHDAPGHLSGSVAAALLGSATEPVLLVGPGFEPSRRLDAGPVLVALDGTKSSDAAIGPAAAWARHMGVALERVTISATRSPVAAIAQHAAAIHAGLIVLASGARRLAGHALLGPTANDILHDSPVPVLLVPRPEEAPPAA